MFPSASQYATALPDPVTDPQFYEGVNAKRLVAFVIDTLVILLLCAVAILAFGIATLGLGFLAAGPIAFAVALAYRVTMLATRSATLGMMAMGVEFRDHRGQRFDLLQAAIHSTAFSVIFSTMIFQVASIVTMLSTPRAQGLPDLLIGSALINRPA